MNRLIAWFAGNHVAANLLMFGILIAGLMSVPSIKQTIFPDIELKMISITVVYPGAAPEEVEKSVTIRVEEKIQDVDGIKEIRSSSNEGAANVTIELLDDADTGRALDEIQARVNSIDTFPEEIERPIVQEIIFLSKVLDVGIHGDADERTLKVIGQRMREDIAQLPGVSQVDLTSVRPYEISLELSEWGMRRHGLRFDDVVAAVQRSSLDVPGGSVKTAGGEILLRTSGQAYHGAEFARIPLLTREDGSRVMLGDVANVVDGFAESDRASRFDGENAVFIQVHRVGSQKALEISSAVRSYLDQERPKLPRGVSITIWDDNSQYLGQRITMMLRNARNGFVLVLVLLAIFLKLRVAFWVALGVPVSIAGALAVMPAAGLDINILTTFSFIMALGILVDDAIVTGENIYTHQERDPSDPLRCSIVGTQEVSVPVIFGVLTTIAAFAPFSFVGGHARAFSTSISGVMIAALAFSLIESKLVLPSHLAHASGVGAIPKHAISIAWARFQKRVARGLSGFTRDVYGPAVERCIEWRYLTTAISIAVFVICWSIVSSGHVPFVMMPSMQSDSVRARLTLPQGTPVSITEDAVARLEAAAETLRAELDAGRATGEPSMIRHVFTSVGSHNSQRPGGGRPGGLARSHLAQVSIELLPSEVREITTEQIKERWRLLVGPIAGAEEFTFSGSFRQFGEPIDIELRGDEVEELVLAANAMKDALAQYPGVHDIRDSFHEGKQELSLSILPSAEALGLSLYDVGRQVRQAFYGAEAQRIQRGRDEVKVMVRLPQAERRSLADVENLRIRLPDGTAVPFTTVAQADLGRGYSSIFRRHRQRAVSVTADIEEGVANANQVVGDIVTNVLPGIRADYLGVSYAFEGEQKEQREAMDGLRRGFIVSLLAIFALLAIPLLSYLQPIVIMAAIPFGYVGAVVGHLVSGNEMSFLSMTGVVACAGVVVNDSLVLTTFLNRLRAEGMPMKEAAARAGQARFRAIMLTSLTTFAGLTPMMLETSVQAQFVIPMAISLAFGVLIATFFTLLLIPSMVIIVEDVKALGDRLHQALRPSAELREPVGS